MHANVRETSHRWEDNIIMDIEGAAHESVEWIHLA
jgi:hypothetical protein